MKAMALCRTLTEVPSRRGHSSAMSWFTDSHVLVRTMDERTAKRCGPYPSALWSNVLGFIEPYLPHD